MKVVKRGEHVCEFYDADEVDALLAELRKPKKLIANYIKGAGGFYLAGATIPENHLKLGVIPLGEIDG